MSETYRYLTKQQRNTIDMADVAMFDYLLKKQSYAQIAFIYDTLAKMHHEGTRLSEDQEKILLHPIKLWGHRAGQVLFEFRKDLWELRKNPPPVLTPEQRHAERKKSLEQFA